MMAYDTAISIGSGGMGEVFKAADPEQVRGEIVTARELLDSDAERISSEFSDRPLIRAHLQGRRLRSRRRDVMAPRLPPRQG